MLLKAPGFTQQVGGTEVCRGDLCKGPWAMRNGYAQFWPAAQCPLQDMMRPSARLVAPLAEDIEECSSDEKTEENNPAKHIDQRRGGKGCSKCQSGDWPHRL